jgi:Baseplate J-like protein
MANLPDIQLDPRSEFELWEQAANHAFNVSNGTLRSFSPSDPLAVLLEGQVYAGAELLWYLNQLPTKLLATWLAAWGIQVTEGSKATGTITANFSSPLPASLVIPIGFTVSGNGVLFSTTATVIAPINATSIDCPVEAIEIGEAGNLPPFSLNQIVTPIGFVRSVFNATRTTGGTEDQTSQEAIDLFVAQTRDGIVSSEQDIERAILKFLGSGWVTRVAVNIDPVTSLEAKGVVAILIDNPSYESIPIGTMAGLQSHLDNICPVNFSPWVAPLERFLVRVRMAVYVAEGVDPNRVAENCYQELLSQVDLPTWDYERIAPLVYRSGGSLGSISINEVPTVRRQNNSRIHLEYLEIRCVDPQGNEDLFLYGNGDPI